MGRFGRVTSAFAGFFNARAPSASIPFIAAGPVLEHLGPRMFVAEKVLGDSFIWLGQGWWLAWEGFIRGGIRGYG